MPDAIRNAPRLLPGLDVFYRAFMDLSSSRTHGLEQGSIPWETIDRYAEANGFRGEQREDLHHYVSAMDRAFLTWSREQRERERPKDPSPRPKHSKR